MVAVKEWGKLRQQVEEYRAKIALLQTSYCYTATVLGEKGEPAFTEKEIEEGSSVVWADSLQAAISLVEQDQPYEWGGCFIMRRDLAFLKSVAS